MLRDENAGPRAIGLSIVSCAVVGALCALLVKAGNPGNMGVCGACFLRDVAGALGVAPGGPAYLRPEVIGVVAGALGLSFLRGRFGARSGGHAVARFVFGAWMGIGALVFLGCPFRMLQRIGGGDLSALYGLAGFLPGVWVGVLLEKRGYSPGKTSPAPLAVGLVGPALLGLLFAAWFAQGLLRGPGPDGGPPPPHAAWTTSLGLAAVVGALLSLTGFCSVSAARRVLSRRRGMAYAALALIGGYAAISVATGAFRLGVEQQPAAHADVVASVLSMALVGLCGVLAGGCPVRQMVMAGEGNADAFVTVFGILVGGAIAHGLGVVSTGVGAAPAARGVILAGLAFAFAYGLLASLGRGAKSAGGPAE